MDLHPIRVAGSAACQVQRASDGTYVCPSRYSHALFRVDVYMRESTSYVILPRTDTRVHRSPESHALTHHLKRVQGWKYLYKRSLRTSIDRGRILRQAWVPTMYLYLIYWNLELHAEVALRYVHAGQFGTCCVRCRPGGDRYLVQRQFIYIYIYIQYVVELNIYIIVVYYYIDIYQDT